MDLYSTRSQERKQKRIDNYLRARHWYSARNRREAVRFERKKVLQKKVYTIAKLNEELSICQEIYLNCFNQIGTAHRLGQLIEKVEQFSISNRKSTNLQESTIEQKNKHPKSQLNSNRIKKDDSALLRKKLHKSLDTHIQIKNYEPTFESLSLSVTNSDKKSNFEDDDLNTRTYSKGKHSDVISKHAKLKNQKNESMHKIEMERISSTSDKQMSYEVIGTSSKTRTTTEQMNKMDESIEQSTSDFVNLSDLKGSKNESLEFEFIYRVNEQKLVDNKESDDKILIHPDATKENKRKISTSKDTIKFDTVKLNDNLIGYRIDKQDSSKSVEKQFERHQLGEKIIDQARQKKNQQLVTIEEYVGKETIEYSSEREFSEKDLRKAKIEKHSFTVDDLGDNDQMKGISSRQKKSVGDQATSDNRLDDHRSAYQTELIEQMNLNNSHAGHTSISIANRQVNDRRADKDSKQRRRSTEESKADYNQVINKQVIDKKKNFKLTHQRRTDSRQIAIDKQVNEVELNKELKDLKESNDQKTRELNLLRERKLISRLESDSELLKTNLYDNLNTDLQTNCGVNGHQTSVKKARDIDRHLADDLANQADTQRGSQTKLIKTSCNCKQIGKEVIRDRELIVDEKISEKREMIYSKKFLSKFQTKQGYEKCLIQNDKFACKKCSGRSETEQNHNCLMYEKVSEFHEYDKTNRQSKQKCKICIQKQAGQIDNKKSDHLRYQQKNITTNEEASLLKQKNWLINSSDESLERKKSSDSSTDILKLYNNSVDDDLPDLQFTPTLSSSNFPSIDSLISSDLFDSYCSSMTRFFPHNFQPSIVSVKPTIETNTKKDSRESEKSSAVKCPKCLNRSVYSSLNKHSRNRSKKESNKKSEKDSHPLRINFRTFWDILKNESDDKDKQSDSKRSKKLIKFKKKLFID